MPSNVVVPLPRSVPSNVVVPQPMGNPEPAKPVKKDLIRTVSSTGGVALYTADAAGGGKGDGAANEGKSDSTGGADSDLETKVEEVEKVLHGNIMRRHDPMAVQQTDWGMVHPLSPFMKYWDIATLFLLLFTAIVTPFEVAFVSDVPLSPMYFVNLFVNASFFFDLCLNFNLMYFSEKQMKMISTRKEVALNYLKGFFIIDFMSILPYDDISTATGGGGNLKILRVVRIARLAKLLRILRSSRIFARFENSMTINYGALKLFKFIVGTLFIAHWMACLWHLIKVIEVSKCNWVDEYYYGACADPPADDEVHATKPISMYTTALYLSVMTISTVGYGDVTPQTEAERMYLIFAMLIGASVYAYVVGSICSIIASMNMRETEFQELMDQLNTFIGEAKIEKNLALRMRAFFRYRRHTTSFKSWHALLQMMSPSMRGEVAIQLNKGWMAGIEFLEGIPQTVIIELSFAFVLETYPPEERIINEDDESNKLYVIKQGVVISRGIVKTTNGVFGEDMLYRTRQRGYRAVTLSFTDTYTVSNHAMEKVLVEYPSIKQLFRKIAVQKIVVEKIVESARIVKEYTRFMSKWKLDNETTRNPTMGASMDFLKNVIGDRVHVSFPAKLLLIRVSDELYYQMLDKHAAFLQRIFRGHQARKYVRLRKEAKDKGVPVSLLNVKSVQMGMKSNPNADSSRNMLKQKNALSRIPAGNSKYKPPMSPEMVRLKDELMASLHEIFKETIREELAKR